ncbi:hypothetical protein [Streptomyces sp. NBC_00467]|uniref:hypothetical protein n=1 Tax=Streptomyces sp. NBC_00467 TaxID=2975752 RepID=UPI002E18A97B
MVLPDHGIIRMMWFFLVPLLSLIALASWVDWTARRRRSRMRSGTAMGRDVRDARRDVDAWQAGSMGHSGEDISWMKKRAP